MAQFAGKAVVAIDNLAVDHDTATHTGTQGNHDEILHTAGRAIRHFAHGCRIGVIGQRHGDAVHGLGQHLGKRNLLGAAPGKVRRILNLTLVEVTVRSTGADAADAAFGIRIGDDPLQRSSQFVDERCHIGVRIRPDDRLGYHISAGVNHAAFGGLSTYIDTDNKIFFHVYSVLAGLEPIRAYHTI